MKIKIYVKTKKSNNKKSAKKEVKLAKKTTISAMLTNETQGFVRGLLHCSTIVLVAEQSRQLEVSIWLLNK